MLIGTVGTYILQRELGRGAVGHVGRAKRAADGKFVAVKIVNPRMDLLAQGMIGNISTRFKREAMNGLKLEHNHVVSVLDHGSFQRSNFLVMELALNSCRELLDAAGKFSTADAAVIIDACCQALAYLHANGCIHRDVKPDNILKLQRGFVLGDLGIVKWSDLNPAFVSAGTITRDSVQLGSWFYMAPEQQRAPHDAVEAIDIYALGVTWYELLSGETLPPQYFAAGAVPDATGIPELNDLIRQMTSFHAQNRPAISSVLAVSRRFAGSR